jgi:hypothetical protein
MFRTQDLANEHCTLILFSHAKDGIVLSFVDDIALSYYSFELCRGYRWPFILALPQAIW